MRRRELYIIPTAGELCTHNGPELVNGYVCVGSCVGEGEEGEQGKLKAMVRIHDALGET